MVGFIITGLSAGFVAGLLGVGGGVILVPALIFVLGISIHGAIGISLAVIVPTALTGAYKHFLSGNVDLKVAAIVAVFAMVGSWTGASLATYISAATLKKAFAIFLIVIGFNMLFGWTNQIAQKYARIDTSMPKDRG